MTWPALTEWYGAGWRVSRAGHGQSSLGLMAVKRSVLIYE